MSLRKDKEKVLGEVFTEEKVKFFLTYPAPEGVDADYHLLEKAYRGMRGENFSSFIQFFLAEGHNLNAIGPDGKTLLQVIKTHRNGEEYVLALEAAGAK